jgi:hypothetical protein
MKTVLSKKEIKTVLRKLSSPQKIQDYLESIPFNHEYHGETCYSAEKSIAHNRAHCLEGAFIAYAALSHHNIPAKLVCIKVKNSDYDHMLTIYKKNNYYGAISKTNHAVLGYRDPIYKTIRELLLTYFHEYYLIETGEKTMLGYTRPFTLERFGSTWLTGDENQFNIAYIIADMKFISIVPKENKTLIRKATLLERRASSIRNEDILK